MPDIYHNQDMIHNGQFAKLDTRGFTLLTTSLSRNDSGQYKCLIDNGVTPGNSLPANLDVTCEYCCMSYPDVRYKANYE